MAREKASLPNAAPADDKKRAHILPSRKQRTAYKAQHEEWHLNSTCLLYTSNRVLGRRVRQAGSPAPHQTPGRRHGAGLRPQEEMCIRDRSHTLLESFLSNLLLKFWCKVDKELSQIRNVFQILKWLIPVSYTHLDRQARPLCRPNPLAGEMVFPYHKGRVLST